MDQRQLQFQFLATIGIILNILWKTAPYEDVLKQRVPWDTLLMLSFTEMYMALAKSMGIVDYMSELLQNTIPANLIIPGIVLIMCVLSFFVSGAVIVPMMLPLLSVLSAASGASTAAIYCATQMGLTASSISPFSQGGAAVLTGCSDESLRRRLIRQQTILAPIFFRSSCFCRNSRRLSSGRLTTDSRRKEGDHLALCPLFGRPLPYRLP